MDNITCIPVVIQGTHREIGEQFGELSKATFSSFLQQSSTWKELEHWKGSETISQIRDNVMIHFPWVWEELEGMATTLGMNVLDILLWNSRGDLLHSTQDGCSSVTCFSKGVPTCGHNEDGDPFLYSKCHFVDVRPLGFPRFVSFFYPGSIPGHSFGFNSCHIMHTVNNVRMKFNKNEDAWRLSIPRMVISRALLACASMTEAVDLLVKTRPIGGFHYTLCKMATDNALGCDIASDPGSLCVLSIEHTSEKCSVIHLNPGVKFVHTNHTVHDEYMSASHVPVPPPEVSAGGGLNAAPRREIFEYPVSELRSADDVEEVVTLSSFTRYQRASDVVKSSLSIDENGETCMHLVQKVLTDTSDESINNCPIFRRQPDDPDEENTHVTVVFTVTPDASEQKAEDVPSNAGGRGICQMSVYNFRESDCCEPILTMSL
jgi:hypothetical protein